MCQEVSATCEHLSVGEFFHWRISYHIFRGFQEVGSSQSKLDVQQVQHSVFKTTRLLLILLLSVCIGIMTPLPNVTQAGHEHAASDSGMGWVILSGRIIDFDNFRSIEIDWHFVGPKCDHLSYLNIIAIWSWSDMMRLQRFFAGRKVRTPFECDVTWVEYGRVW